MPCGWSRVPFGASPSQAVAVPWPPAPWVAQPGPTERTSQAAAEPLRKVVRGMAAMLGKRRHSNDWLSSVQPAQRRTGAVSVQVV